MNSLVQIVPHVARLGDGVADYAALLGGALQAAKGAAVYRIGGDPREESGATGAVPRCFNVAERTPLALVAALEKTGDAAKTLVLHYVNYGYAARGCPFWLVAGLEGWRRQNPTARLLTIFHELFAFGPPWRSSFWLSAFQRRLASKLCEISTSVISNSQETAKWLRQQRTAGESPVAVLPVFSTMGEPDPVVPWEGRPARMIVAGRSGDHAYGRHGHVLQAACRAMGIGEIVDIGFRPSPVPAQVGGIRVTALGHLERDRAAGLLASARAGFLDYPSNLLGKSTVFAAYAAYGMVPVVSTPRGEDEGGLKNRLNYWIPGEGGTGAPDFARIASEASAWYSTHSLGRQANEYAKWLSL